MDNTPTPTTEKELDEFRAQWKQEVNSSRQHQQQQQQQQPQQPLGQTQTAATGLEDVVRQAENLSIHSAEIDKGKSDYRSKEDVTMASQLVETSDLVEEDQDDTEHQEEVDEPATAMAHYIKAVDHERQGQLGKALYYYRQAFRLNRDIDYDYKRHYQTHILPEMQKEEQQMKKAGGGVGDISGDGSGAGLDHSGEGVDGTFRHIVPMGIEYEQPKITSETETFSYTWQDPLAPLMDEFLQQDIEYVPALDYKPVLISKLPNEVMLVILKYLFLHSLSSSAKVALVCKRFFLLSRTPSLWRYLCEHAYRLPDMTMAESRRIQADQVKRYYGGGWYNMFVERPRIRYDGVYISTCHYVRLGTSKTTWNQPVHLVTYYRYLRFFTDGRVVKHVTTDEPADVVKLLDESFSKRQTFQGRFHWKQDESNDDDKQGSSQQQQKPPMTILRIDVQDYTLPFEHFFLQLAVKGTHRGRHNKLRWKKYTSINQQQLEEHYYRQQQQHGQEQPHFERPDLVYSILEGQRDGSLEAFEHVYDLKRMKPYYFSPVRSYRVEYPDDDDDI